MFFMSDINIGQFPGLKLCVHTHQVGRRCPPSPPEGGGEGEKGREIKEERTGTKGGERGQ